MIKGCTIQYDHKAATHFENKKFFISKVNEKLNKIQIIWSTS